MLHIQQFYLEKPTIKRKQDITDYINELVTYNSDINGIEIFAKILDGYTFEQVLEYSNNLEKEEYAKKLNKAQIKTYLLIRKNDNKLIGAINIRWNQPNNNIFNGNIGYGIRPSERKKGYNKINLYLGLIEAHKLGLNKVKLVCETNNIASVKTITSLGGILDISKIDPYDGLLTSIYYIDTKKTINKYQETYKNNIYNEKE